MRSALPQRQEKLVTEKSGSLTSHDWCAFAPERKAPTQSEFLLEKTSPGVTWLKRILVGTAVSSGAVLLAGTASLDADDFDAEKAVTVLGQQTSLLWVVIGAMLVIFMQTGFALVEAGFCRAKHAAHVVSTNFAIFGLGFIAFFFVGFPLAFGGFSYAPMGLEAPIGDALLRSGNWVFLWKGGWALSGRGITPALLGFFLYMG
ncbi:MAG: ammonium transporter [Actinobacteria bacterium]|nr:ammonium transporter [Actinomycetota bacterium]